ncbi:hypothetical protein C3L33_11436, partial [Rhododendron williamsianum]
MTITGSSEKLALQALKSCDWHLEGAFDVFYSQPQVKSYADTRLVEELYKRYKGKRYNSVGFCSSHPLLKSLCVCFEFGRMSWVSAAFFIKKLNVFYHELVVAILAERTFCSYPYVDMILADGITLLCNDLQVDPQDVVMLVLSWHMKAATMCEFSKQEFIGGLQALGIDSLEKFRDRMQFMRSELKDDQKFREIYIFAFGWAKEKIQFGTAKRALKRAGLWLNQMGNSKKKHCWVPKWWKEIWVSTTDVRKGLAGVKSVTTTAETESLESEKDSPEAGPYRVQTSATRSGPVLSECKQWSPEVGKVFRRSASALRWLLVVYEWSEMTVGSEVFGIGYCNRDVAVAFCRKAVAIGGSLVSVLAGSGCWGSLSMERFQFSSLKSSFLSSENWQRQAPFDVQVLWVLPIGASLRLQKQDMCWIILKESLSIYGKLATVELEKLRILEKLKYLEVKPELLRHRHMLALPQPQAKPVSGDQPSLDTSMLPKTSLLLDTLTTRMLVTMQFVLDYTYHLFRFANTVTWRPGITKQSLGTPGLNYWNLQ